VKSRCAGANEGSDDDEFEYRPVYKADEADDSDDEKDIGTKTMKNLIPQAIAS